MLHQKSAISANFRSDKPRHSTTSDTL